MSSQRLHTALNWALVMTREAQRNAEEARRGRARLGTVLRSLEEAYVRLERANEALIFARAEAEKAYRFKADFVANVSHELRTPLNLIIGFSEMMAMAPESYGGVTLPSEYRGDVMAVYRSASHLKELIDDVLDLSQIEAGRLPLTRKPTDLGDVIEEACEIVRGLGQAKGLRLEALVAPDLPILRLDATRIRQVILNLLSNALRFTDQGFIRVRAWVEDREVIVTVEDTGQGISPDKLDRAFEAFSQLDDELLQEGSGLGLAVSRRFVQLHGGLMSIQSALGDGTTVRFTLPLPEIGIASPCSPFRASFPMPKSAQGCQVLVLDDDPQAVGTLRRYTEGYQFLLADAVEPVQEIVTSEPLAAVLIDRSWADNQGNDVTSLLPGALPVLSCSLPSWRRASLALGVLDHLVKPLTRETLVRAVDRLATPPDTILAVDDDPGFLRLLTRMLGALEPTPHIVEASSGGEGLELLHTARPDLVLLDLVMPQVDGYQFLAAMSHWPEVAATPVIVISAQTAEEEGQPVAGGFSVAHDGGFSTTQVLQLIQGTLDVVTGRAVVAPASE
jgi:signal transduction histidine kinase/DNA-binding response OmpR family regulator